MNYCSISDAWGNKNNNIETFHSNNNIESQDTFNTNNDSQYAFNNNNSNTFIIEQSKQSLDSTMSDSRNDKKNIKMRKSLSCDEIFEHINDCHYCNEKMRLKYKSNLIKNFTQNNNDTCILILVAVFVYLFFKLLNKL